MNLGQEFRNYSIHNQGISSNAFDSYANHITNLTPNIIEERQMNIAVMDVFSRLMKDRVIFVGTGIDDQVSNIVVAQLLFLESVDSEKDITMYLNSPGGSVYSGLAMIDTMNYIKPDVATVCTGLAASMGAMLLVSGEKSKRAALPHSRIMIHQPLGGAQGQASDIEITYKEISKLKTELYEILAERTGQSYEKIESDADRDYWMKADEAKEYGMIDEVLRKR